MLDLSRVTLLVVETRAHKISKRVIEDCLHRCNFGDVLIFTDKPGLIPIAGARYIAVPDFPNKREAGAYYYGRAMAHVKTDFALLFEWDAGIFDENRWLPEFFKYDYIGAPWNINPRDPTVHHDVGNGGFTLMSKRLGHYICENVRRFPVYTDMDVSRTHRASYELAGFRWPDRHLAGKFSWELVARDRENFGFHGVFTWPWMLSRTEMITRATLMLETPYLLVKLDPLVQKWPTIWQDLPAGAEAKFAAECYNYNTQPRPGHHTPRSPFLGIMQRQLMERQRRLQVRIPPISDGKA